MLILADDGLEPASVARYLHGRSRAGQPFVEIDCAHGSAEDIEAACSVTGRARIRRPRDRGAAAAVLAARRGTLFIDHLGDLPAASSDGSHGSCATAEVRTNGRDRVRIAARIVAAAPPSLVSDAREGRFRADLLRRFAGARSRAPAQHAARGRAGNRAASRRRTCGRANRVPPSFTQPALTVLSAFQWPGNIADLREALERILRDLPASIVRQEDVLPTMPVEGIAAGRMTPRISLREARRRFEREYIAAVLEQHQWRMSDAARTLGIERANLYRKARQLGISREEMRTERPR